MTPETTDPMQVHRAHHDRSCRRDGLSCEGAFLCMGCQRWKGWCKGASDAYLDYCNECFARATSPKRSTPR